jgi:hypothetical protein
MHALGLTPNIAAAKPLPCGLGPSRSNRETTSAPRKRRRRLACERRMLSASDVDRAAELLFGRLGESAIARAMLRKHDAQLRGAFVEMTNWHRIAESTLLRLAA